MNVMLAENLKYLRKKHNLSQQQLAEVLDIARTTLGDYERAHTEPSLDTLIRIADYFKADLDQLLRGKMHHQEYEIVSSPEMKVLAISVDQANRQNIEVVGVKARAGYLQSYQDPEYIRDLPKMYFPQIPEGTYRAFEIEGDSMLPMMPGSLVVCSYVEELEEMKNDRTYVIATHLDGIVYKRVLLNPDRKSVTALSDNPAYPPYKIPYRDIAEIWKYYAHLSFSDAKFSLDYVQEDKINDIQEKVTYIKNLLEEEE